MKWLWFLGGIVLAYLSVWLYGYLTPPYGAPDSHEQGMTIYLGLDRKLLHEAQMSGGASLRRKHNYIVVTFRDEERYHRVYDLLSDSYFYFRKHPDTSNPAPSATMPPAVD